MKNHLPRKKTFDFLLITTLWNIQPKLWWDLNMPWDKSMMFCKISHRTFCGFISMFFPNVGGFGWRLQAVEDPGFPRGGGSQSSGGGQHTILPNFPKNCMKMKKFGPLALTDPRGHQGCLPTWGSKFFLFHVVFGKKFEK